MEKFLKGIPGSGGFAIGSAVVFSKSNILIPKYTIKKTAESIEKEIDKLETALNKTRNQLDNLKKELESKHSPLETGYLDTTILMLEDPILRNRVMEKLKQSYLNIEWIFNKVIEEIAEKLGNSENNYFRERAPDVISLGTRVLKNLMGKEELEIPDSIKNPVIVAHTLSPPEIVSLYRKKVWGLVTEIGGKTSHVSIMARDFKIPAVVGLSGITGEIKTGDSIIVDGTIGTVVINPRRDTVTVYKYKAKEHQRYENYLSRFEKKESLLKEGEEVTLLANIDLEEELELIKKESCKGIGLFRTEYIFLNRNEFPTEEEQFSIYKRIVIRLNPFEVTIRVIDIGGDKKPPYMEHFEEKNPFLGWRGIRYALSHRDILKSQIRAILRSSVYGNARIMFPMVNDLDEIMEIKKVMKECMEELSREHIPFNEKINTGIMVETPSCVILLDKIAEHIDFISVGTNDLIQYTLAIDRGNGMVASEFDPSHPSILRSLNIINMVCREKHLEASICGEMAGDPLYTLLLIGLGYRKLSMSSMNLPVIKNIIVNSSIKDATKITNYALSLTSKKEITKYIREQMILRFKDMEDYFRTNG